MGFILVLIDRHGVKTEGALEEANKGPMSKMLNDFPTDISIRGHEAELTQTRNDWKGESNGQNYLARLEQLLRGNPATELNPNRSQLKEIFKGELDAVKGTKRKEEGSKANSTRSMKNLSTRQWRRDFRRDPLRS